MELTKIVCPKCQHKNTNKIFKQVTVDHLEKILNQSLFKFKCRQCGYEALLDYSLQYQDDDKKIVIYYRNGGLYLQTTTGNGTGTNPLFIAGVQVKNWQVQRLAARSLRISFALQGQREERSFEQVLTCYNGEISDAQG